MLKSVVHGKAGRIEQKGKPSVSWRTLFKTYEDLMSAAVFSRFSYLSAGAQSYLLQSWLGPSDNFSTFIDIMFWPTYQLDDDKQENDVEPDLMLCFEDCNLIIEVKRPLGGAQDIEQWRREIKSFLQSGEGTDKPLYFLAIGGVSPIWTTWADKLISEFTQNPSKAPEYEFEDTLKQVSALNWQPVVDSILALEKHVLANEQDVRIIKDIIEVFELYDLKTSRFKWPKLVEVHSSTKLSLEHGSLINNKSSFMLKGTDNPTNTNKSLLSLVTQQNKLAPLNMEIISKWSIK
jgi:hypothetical protein